MFRLFFYCLKIILIPLLVVFLFLSLKIFLLNTFDHSLEFYLNLFRHPYFLAVLFGTGIRILLRYLFRHSRSSNPLEFIDTLEHELTHAIFGYLTLSPPVSLLATLEAGGEVQLKRRNILVVLSPYFFPLWGFLALGIGLLVKESIQPFWNLIPFALFGNFLYRLGTEFRWYQNDLKIYGRLFSTVVIALLLFFSFSFIMHFTHILNWRWIKEIVPELLVFINYLR